MSKPLQEVAIQVAPADNVAVCKFGVEDGEALVLSNGAELTVCATSPGHRFALTEIPAGEFVRQYGQPIGTSQGIAAGEAVTPENMSNEIPVVRDLPEDLATPAPEAAETRRTFQGFRRSDGRVGTRNFILIVPASMCASHESTTIATVSEYTLYSREKYPNVDGVVAIPHNKGCGAPDGSNLEVLMRTLENYAQHPNIAGVVFLDLGCEKTNLSIFARRLEKRGVKFDKPVEWIGIQECGGTKAAIDRGLEVVEEMLPKANESVREECPASELSLGVKCGGSDGFSGLSANPSLGNAADRLVSQGGTVLITEVPEFCGAEHVLANRAKDAETGRAVYGLVDWYKEYAGKWGAELGENPSPGNKEGGLLNITIKSLGAIAKAGTTRVEGTTDYADPPSSKGLHLMQGPGYDQESTPGLIGAGAQIVVFTTGRGTTIGNAIAPVLKLASNTPIFERMSHDLDLSAGSVIDGTETIEEVGERVFDHVLACASGEVQAKAEETGHREFQVWAERAVSL